jgi:hypothetical protein
MESPIRLQGQHIKGHQDTLIPFEKLSYTAQGNVLADTLASLALRGTFRNPSILEFSTSLSLKLNNEQIGGNIHHQVKSAIFKPLMIQRWTTLMGIEESKTSQCDWDLFFHCIKTQSTHIRYFYIKFNAKLLPVGTNLKQRRHSDSEKCPCCREVEDHLHLLHCQQEDMVLTFNKCFADIQDLIATNVDPLISCAILTLLKAF